MSVLVASQVVHIVIYVDAAYPFEPYYAVYLVKHAVKVVDYIIPCRVHMACIYDYTHAFIVFNSLDDLSQLFKIFSYL